MDWIKKTLRFVVETFSESVHSAQVNVTYKNN